MAWYVLNKYIIDIEQRTKHSILNSTGLQRDTIALVDGTYIKVGEKIALHPLHRKQYSAHAYGRIRELEHTYTHLVVFRGRAV